MAITRDFRKTPIALGVAVLFGATLAPETLASSTGRLGRSGNPAINSGATCAGCHSGGAWAYTASISGGDTVALGTTASFAVLLTKASGTTAVKGGFNLSATGGGTLLDVAANVRKANNELTHPSPDSPDGSGNFTWNFDWTTPAATGTYTFYACALATDGTSTTGDSNFCTSKTVTVFDPNQPPALNGLDAAPNYVEGSAAVVIDSSLTVTDADDAQLNLAEVAIQDGFHGAEDRLSCPATTLTCAYDDGTGVLTLSGTGTLSAYESALEAVKYDNTSADPSAAPRTIGMRVRDARNAFSAFDTTTLAVTAVDQVAPLPLGPVQPLGREVHVNTGGTGEQDQPGVGRSADGSFVVAWESGSDLFAQRYDARGVPQGTEFQVNSVTGQLERRPVVAMDATGRFVIAWVDGSGVHGQRYLADGTPIAPASNGTFDFGATGSFHLVDHPAIAMDDDGDFVVAAYGYLQGGDNAGVFVQRYAGSGAAVGAPIAVNINTANAQWEPALAMKSDGSFVVAWTDTAGTDTVNFRLYDAAGSPVTGEVAASTALGDQSHPAVAMDPDGNFVVTWDSYPDSEGYGVWARRFDPAGAPLTGELLVNYREKGDQTRPGIAMAANGDFVVTWEDYGAGGRDVYARRFHAAGSPIGGGFKVNTFVSGAQAEPRVGADADGNFVIAWTSGDQEGPGDAGVYAQRFGFVPGLTALADVNGNSAADLAVLYKTPGARNGYVRDGSTAARLATAAFGPAYSAVHLLGLPDLNGNGVPEVAALGRASATGVPRIEAVSASNGAAISGFNFFPATFQVVEQALVGDMNASGAPEIAVLGHGTSSAQVQIRDAMTGTLVNSIVFAASNDLAVALAVQPDQNANGAPEIAVLAKNMVSGAISVQVRDGSTDALINTVPFLSFARTPVDLAVLPDQNGNGAAELAVLAQDAGSAAMVQIRDSATDAILRTIRFHATTEGVAAIAVLDDLNANGKPELAVLVQATSGMPSVQIRDSGDGALLSTRGFLTSTSRAGRMVVSPDIDGNGKQELIVLGTGSDGVRTQTRDADTGAVIRTISYP